MNPPRTSTSTTQPGLPQTVRMPRDSDGVGNALRQIFCGGVTMPAEFGALLNRLKSD